MATDTAAVTAGWNYHRVGAFQQAAEIYSQVLQADPSNAEVWYLLGVARQAARDPAGAEACYRQALRIDPRHLAAGANLGMTLVGQGKLDEAAAAFRQVLRFAPEHADVLNNLGVVLTSRGEAGEAIPYYREALRCRPNYAEAHNNLGFALARQGQLDEAVACYRAALALRPDYAEAYNNLGNALQEQGKIAEAVTSFRVAIRLRPGYTEAHNNLGGALLAQDRLDEAVACYQEVLRCNPAYADAHNNLGFALTKQGRWDEALACYEQALRLRPDHPVARANRALAWLTKGNLEQGWPEFEWRWQCIRGGRRTFQQPLWDGSELPGQALLLHAEGGLGDTLQFIRYAALAKRRAGTVLVECPSALIPLLAGCPGVDGLIPACSPLPAFAAHAPLLSLPGIFGTRLETTPAEVPYLFADAGLAERWREKLSSLRGFRVGIVWRSSSTQAEASRRSAPLARFEPLARVRGVHLVSLQKGPGTEQLHEVAGRFPVIDLGNRLDEASGPFMDTAAVIRNLDLVITIDTSVAHLAGALGCVPVWAALPFAAEWRWLLNREDSPWYPTMRLFRQPRPGDWEGLFDRMAAELTKDLLGQPFRRAQIHVA
jgi:tetratricopeptide (TPR) repeat protein